MDISVHNHGSVVMLAGESDAGKAWLDEHVPVEGWAHLGNGRAVEPRYVDAIVDGARNDGLEVG